MKIICKNCKKKISMELTEGICPKCGYINRNNMQDTSVFHSETIPKPVISKENYSSSKPIQSHKNLRKVVICIVISCVIIIVGKSLVNYISNGYEILKINNLQKNKTTNAVIQFDTVDPTKYGEVVIVDNVVVDYIPVSSNKEIEQNIIIPEGVVEIGEKAFYNVSGAKDIMFPSTLKKVSERAFYGCDNVEESILPEGLEIVEDYAFEGIHWWAEELPTSLKEIGVYSFASVQIENQEKLPPNASVTSTSFNYDSYQSEDDMVIVGTNLIRYQGQEKEVEIPFGITEIGDNAFKDNKKITSVIIPEGVTYIGKYAFEKATDLSVVTLPSTLVTIEEYAFADCAKLTNILFPNKLKKIGDNAFYFCESLDDITIPDSVVFLSGSSFLGTLFETNWDESHWGSYAMLGNKILVQNTFEYEDVVTIPEGVLHIASKSLMYYDELGAPSKIIFPDSILTIQDFAIRTWGGDTIILEIPSSVTYIGGLNNGYDNNNYIIMCEKDSYAYTYAQENDFEIQVK